MLNIKYRNNNSQNTVNFDRNKSLAEFLQTQEEIDGAAISINGSIVTASEMGRPLVDFVGGAESCNITALRKTDHNSNK